MCGRFFVDGAHDDAILTILDEAETRERRRDPDFSLKRGDIAPGDISAVIAPDRARHPAAFVMQWGFHENGRLVFNARSETAARLPLFRQSMKERRCLIPATCYYEWDHREKKPPRLSFVPANGSPLMLAGLYRFEEGSRRPAFTILTRPAAPDIACIHDRMPVILPENAQQRWLDSTVDPSAVMKEALSDVRWMPA